MVKKFVVSAATATLLMAPVFVFADQTADLIQQLQAKLEAIQAQLNVFVQQQQQVQQSQTSQQQASSVSGSSEFQVGDAIRTVVVLNIRSSAGLSGTILGKAPAGSTGVIRCSFVLGSACRADSNGMTWWHIDWNNSSLPNGWSAEGVSEATFLEKVPSPGGTPQQQSSVQSTQQSSLNQTQSTQQQSGGQCTFGKLYASPYTDVASTIASTQDGGYILGGSTNLRDTRESYLDLLVQKIDANGKINWQKIFNRGYSGLGISDGFGRHAFPAVAAPDGGYLAATNIGNSKNQDGTLQGGSGLDLLLTKLDASGAVQWQKSFGRGSDGQNYQYPLFLQRVSGGYVVAGQTWKQDNFTPGLPLNTFYSTSVLKVDDQGNIIWQKRYGTQEGAGFSSFAQTPDGGYLLSVSSFMKVSTIPWPVHGVVFFKLDASGNIQWTKDYANVGTEGAGIALATDGGFIIVEDTIDIQSGLNKIILLKLDSSGELQWTKAYGTQTGREFSTAVKQTPDGGYLVLGNTRDDILLFKLNASGDIVWQKVYSSGPVWSAIGEEDPADFILTQDGGYAIVGKTNRFATPGNPFAGNTSDILAFKVDASGNISFSASGWSAKDTNLQVLLPSITPRHPDSGGVGVVDPFDLSSSSFSANASDANLSEKDLSHGTCGATIVTTNTPSITVLSPNGGEQWQKGTTQTIKWSAPSSVSAVSISLEPWYACLNSVPRCEIAIRPYTLTASTQNDGVFEWTVGKDASGADIPAGEYTLTVSDGTSSDASDAPFSITVPSGGTPSITVLSPNGGEQFALGSKQYIKWSTSNFGNFGDFEGPTVRINLQKNDIYLRNIFDSTVNDGIATWVVPSDLTPANDYKIVIRKSDDLSVYDKSDAPFSITSPSSSPDLIISVPPSVNSGTLVAGQTLTFKAIVKNQGTADATGTFNNRFRIDMGNDGVINASTTDPDLTPYPVITNLAAGASQQVVSAPWTAVAGTHRLYSCADRPPPSPGAIAESDETNNCAWGDTFTVATQ